MPALDTIASYQGTSGSTLAAGTMATGDPNTIRNFPAAAPNACLIEAMYDYVTSPQACRVRSPLLHDNVRGIQFTPGASVPPKLLPSFGAYQELEAQDTLTFELSTAATTGKALLGLSIYYPQLPGAASRLYAPGDVIPRIVNIKPVYVAVGSGANTAGQWYDLVLTTTEQLLKANTDYAVLGLLLDVAVAALAVKGPDTGNLRCSVPGGANDVYGADYFVRKSVEANLPLIPVINAANAGSTYVSLISSAATGAASTFQVILGQLGQNLS